jgi:5'-deoxynucleotidase YfbR-like HD superfamily hydrolase
MLGGEKLPSILFLKNRTHEGLSVEISEEIISLAKRGETLKRIGRSGWAIAGVENLRLESVGEHSYGTILISLLISKTLLDEGEQVDLFRVAALAAIHDIPESITSDIPRVASEYGGDLLRASKREVERKVIKQISEECKSFEEWLMSLWDITEDEMSLEVRIVLGSDIIDMLVHANALEVSGVSPAILDRFFVNSHLTVRKLGLNIFEETFWYLY